MPFLTAGSRRRLAVRPRRRQTQARDWGQAAGFHVAEAAGEVVGALVVGLPADFAPTLSEPDLYINLLLADVCRDGQGIGARLLDHARDLARAAGVGLLRRDCHDGDDRSWCEGRASPRPPRCASASGRAG